MKRQRKLAANEAIEEPEAVAAEPADDCQEEGKKKRIRKRKSRDMEDAPGEAHLDMNEDCTEAQPEEAKPKRSKKAAKVDGTGREASSDEVGADKAYQKAMSKKLPTREERQRRENQRKMQVFVAALRERGYEKKDIEKLKRKINSKIRSIQPHTPFMDVIGDNMSDRHLTCKDCAKEYVFSVREQAFYQEKRFPDPARCKQCAAEKKLRMAAFDSKY